MKKINRTTSLGLIFSLSFVLTFPLAANRQHKGGVQRRVVTVQRPVAAAAAGNHQFALPEGQRPPNQGAGLQNVDGRDDGFNARSARVGRVRKKEIKNPVKVGPDLLSQNDATHRWFDKGLPDGAAAASSRSRKVSSMRRVVVDIGIP